MRHRSQNIEAMAAKACVRNRLKVWARVLHAEVNGEIRFPSSTLPDVEMEEANTSWLILL